MKKAILPVVICTLFFTLASGCSKQLKAPDQKVATKVKTSTNIPPLANENHQGGCNNNSGTGGSENH